MELQRIAKYTAPHITTQHLLNLANLAPGWEDPVGDRAVSHWCHVGVVGFVDLVNVL